MQQISCALRLSAYFFLLGFFTLNLSGCAETQLVSHAFKRMAGNEETPSFKLGKPYKINERWYTPAIDMGYQEEGIASWYGPDFHGKYTANGEVYNKFAMTAAHRTLPLPTVVRVTNLENGLSTVLRINDRGPFIGDRIIDLSYAAAKKLDMDKKGLARVRVELLQEETLALYARTPGAPTVAELFPKPAEKPFRYAEAQPTQRPAVSSSADPVTRSSATPGRVQVSSLEPVAVAAPSPSPAVEPLFNEEKIYIQAASFSDYANALRLKQQIASSMTHKLVSVSPTDVGGQAFYRVRLGPFESSTHAQNYLTKVVQMGVNGAKIVADYNP